MRIGLWILVAVGALGCGGDKDASDTGDTDGGGPPLVFANRNEHIVYLAENATPADIAAGKVVYEQLPGCAECHQVDGKGTSSFPDLAVRLPLIDNTRVANVMLLGIPAQPGKVGMPPYAADWTDQEIGQVIAYIRDAFDPSAR